jgi:hypothetical protein
MNSEKEKKPRYLFVLIPAIILFIYFYPRFLISQLGADNPWTSYLYMYGFGGVFFSIGMFMILKTKSCKLSRGRDSLYFNFLIGGFIYFATVHGLWIWLSLNLPVNGVN